MSIENIRAQMGPHAKDIKINLGNIFNGEPQPDLSLNQTIGIALACAYATKDKVLIEAVEIHAADFLSNDEVHAAKAAATVMAMNNVYYRFVHLVSDKDYANMPANLRMQIIANLGIEKVDFELYSLAVSAINGCGMCIDSHVTVATKAGISKLGVQSTIRIAAIVNAAAQAIVLH